MLGSFAFSLPTQVIFGRPALEALDAQLDALHATRVLLVSDPGIASLGWPERYCAELAGGARPLQNHAPLGRDSVPAPARQVAVFTNVSSNPTTAEVAAGLAIAKEQDVEAVVALGGGSAIDVAKAIAMLLANGGAYADYQWGGKAITERSRPVIAIPTTAGTGSEVSKVMVLVDPERPFKKGVLSPLMFPHAAIIDPELTRSLPPHMTAATGMDALIHALEAYVGQRANPFTDQFALAALETAWHALPVAVANGQNLDARQQMALAAVWGGIAMDQGGLGLIHALSGPLTSHLHLHHGLANALILPYVMRFNLPALAPGRRRRLCSVMGLAAEVEDDIIVDSLTQFVRDLGLPTRLSELERPVAGADWAAIAEETPRMVLIGNNPRPATALDCAIILDAMQ